MEWTGGTRDAGKGRGKGKGGKAGRAPGKELFASNVHTLFLLVEIGFCSALFNVWLQLGRISVGGMSDVEERMAVQEMMDGDVYLLTGLALKWQLHWYLFARSVFPWRFLAVQRGRGHEVEDEVHFPPMEVRLRACFRSAT